MQPNLNPQTTGKLENFTRRLRGFALNIFVLLATTCICLALGEFATRLLFPQFTPNAQLRFQVMPGGFALGPPGQAERHATPKGDFNVQVKFNQHGFRDVKDLRDATRSDWFVVGDSFTLGFGVDEDKRYSNMLEQKLHAAGNPANIYNIGIPGNLIDYERLVNYAEGQGAKINNLIIGVCMDNDLENYADGKSDWETMPYWKISTKEKIRSWFRTHSALYITTTFVIQRSSWSRRLMEKLGLASDINTAFDTGATQPDPAILKGGIAELLKLAAGRNTVVLLIPTRRLWFGGTSQGDVITHEKFAQMCRDAGLNVVDPRPVFDKDPNPLSFYFAHDPHWSPRGNEIAAEELIKAVQARK